MDLEKIRLDSYYKDREMVYKELYTSQNKSIYYILALTVACLGYSIEKTTTDIFIIIINFILLGSIISGVITLLIRNYVLHINIEIIENEIDWIHDGKITPKEIADIGFENLDKNVQEDLEELLKTEDKKIKGQKQIATYFAIQLILLILGIVGFMVWYYVRLQ